MLYKGSHHLKLNVLLFFNLQFINNQTVSTCKVITGYHNPVLYAMSSFLIYTHTHTHIHMTYVCLIL